MSRLRLAILKEISNKDAACIILEYSEEQLVKKLKGGILRQLVKTESWYKKKWSREEILCALENSWEELVSEFKEETVKLL
jgi:hypothetical protein